MSANIPISILICDNYNQYLSNSYGPFSIREHTTPKSRVTDAVKDLEQIANKSLAQLKEENPNLLILLLCEPARRMADAKHNAG